MNYKAMTLKEEFRISNIFSIHYFEYDKDFTYKGEVHDFWEFVYIDKGAIDVIAGEKKHRSNRRRPAVFKCRSRKIDIPLGGPDT